MISTLSTQSASAISVVVMAAAIHPEAQRRAQQQIDLVVGRDRRTSASSIPVLPDLLTLACSEHDSAHIREYRRAHRGLGICPRDIQVEASECRR